MKITTYTVSQVSEYVDNWSLRTLFLFLCMVGKKTKFNWPYCYKIFVTMLRGSTGLFCCLGPPGGGGGGGFLPKMFPSSKWLCQKLPFWGWGNILLHYLTFSWHANNGSGGGVGGHCLLRWCMNIHTTAEIFSFCGINPTSPIDTNACHCW